MNEIIHNFIVNEGQKTNRSLVMVAVLAAMFMVSIEVTIVATAMPQIVGDLGGLRYYSWVFASFLLTQTAATAVFGKLADVFGRKPIILTGIALFLVSSILCGFAWSMPSLICFRLAQGAGAGAVQPVALTIVADLFPGRERGKVQGYLSSVWAISAVLGPIVGGLIVRDFSWSWVFWMNLPLGLLASASFWMFLHEPAAADRQPIDILGALLLVTSTGAFLLALTELGSLNIQISLIALAVFGLSSFFFIKRERASVDPILDFKLWAHRAIAATNGVAVLANMALIGLTSFLPMYVQVVLHRSPVIAGLALTMTMVGWPFGATFAARSFHRFGLRRLLIIGAAFVPTGATTFTLLTPASSPVLAGIGSLVMGFGMGIVSVCSLVLIQETVDSHQRASATASNMFSRNLGSALGAALLGAVLNFSIIHSGGTHSGTFEDLQRFLAATPRAEIVGGPVIEAALQHGLNQTFGVMLALSVLIVPLALAVPNIPVKEPPRS